MLLLIIGFIAFLRSLKFRLSLRLFLHYLKQLDNCLLTEPSGICSLTSDFLLGIAVTGMGVQIFPAGTI